MPRYALRKEMPVYDRRVLNMKMASRCVVYSSEKNMREAHCGDTRGFTLVELLVTMCVSLMLLGGVVSLFGSLGESVNDSKSDSKCSPTR